MNQPRKVQYQWVSLIMALALISIPAFAVSHNVQRPQVEEDFIKAATDYHRNTRRLAEARDALELLENIHGLDETCTRVRTVRQTMRLHEEAGPRFRQFYDRAAFRLRNLYMNPQGQLSPLGIQKFQELNQEVENQLHIDP